MLRKKGFVHVNKLSPNGSDDGRNYNTIMDYCRDGRGEIVEQEIGIKQSKKSVVQHKRSKDCNYRQLWQNFSQVLFKGIVVNQVHGACYACKLQHSHGHCKNCQRS
jgi:hypothetical protein